MWAFQYKHGDRPLEGFTIQRAAGRGGFGEVYYAISDSGREVALKVVQGYEQIELRGISQCMNLKSPHLVTIFDVKFNHENKPFVIMEFVSGPNLRQILDESPAGLGTQKAAFFLREIAKGLSFLHDCGIVHRDLKPANIFYENGYVKIGDYGLSKAIATSQHSGQTVTVGTVHYMAPEIGAGKYDRGIDIYAMGAVLYEMLTGTPPFLGASPSEILMKHLVTEPDLSGVPQPFANVIRKAMAKDPTQRYQHVQEMVEDVFGAEHVRQSVSVFSPEDLSVVAERVARKAVAVGGGGSSSPVATAAARQQARPDVWQRLGSAFEQFGQAAAGRFANVEPSAPPDANNDPLAPRHRWLLAGLVTGVACIAGTVVSMRAMGPPIVSMLFIFTCAWGAAMGVFLASRTIIPRMHSESPFMQKVVIGLFAAVFATVLSMPTWAASVERSTGATLAAIMLPLIFVDTRKWFAADRAERVRLGPIIGAAFCGFLANIFLHGSLNLVIATLAGAAMLVQILAPWDPVAGARTKARKESDEHDDSKHDAPAASGTAAHAQKFKDAMGKMEVKIERATAKISTSAPSQYFYTPVWRFARIWWLAGVVTFLTMGVMFCVAGGLEQNSSDVGPLVAAGVGAFLMFLLCFLQSFRRRFFGWWSYLIRPLVVTFCLIAIVAASIVMGNYPSSMNSEEAVIGTFFIVFPSVLLLVVTFISGKTFKALEVSPDAPTVVPPANDLAPMASDSPAPAAAAAAATFSRAKQMSSMWLASRARRRRYHDSIMFGAISGILIFAAFVTSLSLAMDIPVFLGVGLPEPQAAQELDKVFGARYLPDGTLSYWWPDLLERMGMAAMSILIVSGASLQIFARRLGGGWHILRGLMGTAGVIASPWLIHAAFKGNHLWTNIAQMIDANPKKVGPAIEYFFDRVQGSGLYWSAAAFLASVIFLAWPPPRARPIRAMRKAG